MRILFIFIFSILFISNCSEKISYSGKIIDDDIAKFSKFVDKNSVIIELGQPNFIDPIENKYFYFSEKYKYKNIFDRKIENRTILVFNFNKQNQIISFDTYNLSDQQNIEFSKATTSNDLIERGLMEKVFGGVGKTYVPNTP
ncbi:MAG: hypothetical protein ACJ0RJ_03865 [Alphaproteobacteria bacterium]